MKRDSATVNRTNKAMVVRSSLISVMQRKGFVKAVFGRFTQWFASVNESDLGLRQIDEIGRDVAEWPHSCLRIVIKCIVISWTVPVVWAIATLLLFRGSTLCVGLGIFLVLVSAGYLLLATVVLKVYFHKLAIGDYKNLTTANLDDGIQPKD